MLQDVQSAVFRVATKEQHLWRDMKKLDVIGVFKRDAKAGRRDSCKGGKEGATGQ